MKSWRWQIWLASGLVFLSFMLYLLHFVIFHDLRHILIYLLGDIAFIPVEVLLVTVIIHQLLRWREKQARLNKLNMAIGTFFSEVGTELLDRLNRLDSSAKAISGMMQEAANWSEGDFARIQRELQSVKCVIQADKGSLELLRNFLFEKRPFLLALLENPNLLEHESFTDLLWAVFHITDELAHRDFRGELPSTDLEHLSGDILRAYKHLLGQWLAYMQHSRETILICFPWPYGPILLSSAGLRWSAKQSHPWY